MYCADDPVAAKRLEEHGAASRSCRSARPIGSGLGIQNPAMLSMLIEQAKVPVLVDAGVGTASDAAIAHGAGLRRGAAELGHRRMRATRCGWRAR